MTAAEYNAVITHEAEYIAANNYVNNNLLKTFTIIIYVFFPRRLLMPAHRVAAWLSER
jgi:hypothetical protein